MSDGKKLLELYAEACLVGFKVHELATIRIEKINFDDSSIEILGKGGKMRTVYFSGTTGKYLRAFTNERKSGYLFTPKRSDAAKEFRSNRYFQNRLGELCQKAGVQRITPHQLRHYFATYTLSHGGDVKAVSEMLGHADVTITLKVYHHVNAESIKRMHAEHSPLTALTRFTSCG